MFGCTGQVSFSHGPKGLSCGQVVKDVGCSASNQDVAVYDGYLVILVQIGKCIFFFKYGQVAQAIHSFTAAQSAGHVWADTQDGFTLYDVCDIIAIAIGRH